MVAQRLYFDLPVLASVLDLTTHLPLGLCPVLITDPVSLPILACVLSLSFCQRAAMHGISALAYLDTSVRGPLA